jgi:hypothetical protein
VGFLLATGLTWAGAWYFLDSTRPYDYESAIGRHIAPYGHRHRFRSEGWAVTTYGRFGIAGIPDVRRLDAPKVAIWGDSFVEGMHVFDSQKMAQQVTAIWSRRTGEALVGVGIGGGNRTVTDYYFLIPRYEKITNFTCHVIVLPSLRDVSPDGAGFHSEPEYRLLEQLREQPLPGLRRQLHRIRLDFLWGPLWSVIGRRESPLTQTRIRFYPGPAAVPNPRPRPPIAAVADPEAWRFLLRSLQRQTTQPIVFVYTPTVPAVSGGRIDTEPSEAKLVRSFAACCVEAGIGLIDMTFSFNEFQRRTGEFPRGFANSRPGQGHFNHHGHRLIAEAVCDHLASNSGDWLRHAVHAD